jgi:predicted acyltransferase (DUF342 family)
MSRYVANVDIITDSFEIWLLETNELLHALSTEIITANTTYANTGNSTINRTSQLWGTFGANNLVVTNWVRGGNVSGSNVYSDNFANLYIATNTVVSNSAAANINLMVSNNVSFSYINPVGGYFGNNIANATINTTSAVVQSNSSVNTSINAVSIVVQSNSTVNTNYSAALIQAANSTAIANVTPGYFKAGLFEGNTIAVSIGANVIANATSLYIGNTTQNSVITQTTIAIGNSTVNTTIVANTTDAFIDTDGYLRVLGNTVLSNTLSVTGNTTLANTLVVTGNTTLSNTLVVTGTTTLSNTIVVTGNATLSNTLSVTGNTTLANTLSVTGNTTLANTLTVTGSTTLSNNVSVAGITTFKSDYVVDVLANSDIGSTIGAVLVYRFTKATYASGKFEVQVKNGNTQLSELVLAHDGGTNAYVTTYGTVASNGAASPLGTFTANTDTANVNLYLVQTVANSAVKVIAHLIK